jgi:predicted cobalt transporter CbtA
VVLVYARNAAIRLIGALLIALPHLVGAPSADTTSSVPQSLAQPFAAGSLAVSLVVWLLLGVATATLFSRTQHISRV